MNENICLFPGCNNSVAAITRQNARFSKMYCEEHSKGVDVECSVCHTKHHSRISDVMPVLLNSKPIICRKCSVTALNKTEAMKEQARELGKRTGSINIAKAREKAFTPKAIALREKRKRENGFFEPGGGYEIGLNKRKENGSFDRMLESSHQPDVIARNNKARWNKMSDEEKASVINRLVKGQTEESHRLVIENRVKNNWTPNTKQALEALSKCKKNKDWVKEHPNFFGIELFTEENGELYYKGIPWNEFKNKFISNKNIEISQLAEKVNGFIQFTYREQSSTTWENKSAFERVLQEKGVHWFVYIKFYIDKENKAIKPIVVGKSGSKYVTVNGSDVSFDYLNDTNDFRPARMFLKENNLSWYKESIIIVPCNSEQEALKLEKKLAEELNLFES